MRLYHQQYRQKNPGTSRGALRGAKKDLRSDILKVLSTKRRRNPTKVHTRGQGRAIDALNALGRLNRKISEYDAQLAEMKRRPGAAALRQAVLDERSRIVAVRDVISANVEGYLTDEALSYSLDAALRALTRTEVRIVKELLSDMGGDVSPEEGASIRTAAAGHPDVRRARARATAAKGKHTRATEGLRSASARRRLSDTEYMVGAERHEAFKSQAAEARAEKGDEPYRPVDAKLYEAAKNALLAKYPDRLIPAKLTATRRKEDAAISELSRDDLSANKRAALEGALRRAYAARWRTNLVLAYERAGGKELSAAEYKQREAQRMKKLGTACPLGGGLLGVVVEASSAEKKSSGGKSCKWLLLDSDRKVYMAGLESSKASASKSVNIAYRVLAGMIELEGDAGWDGLPSSDRRWLEDKKPTLSKTVARLLLQNINEKVRVSKTTAKWILSAADIKKHKEEGAESVAQSCKNMTIGEERIFPGPKGKYRIFVKKKIGGKYTFHVETKDGKTSNIRRMNSCEEVVARGHMIGGAMLGADEVARAISNPGKLKRLENSALRHFRKPNPPKMARHAAEEGDIRELIGMQGVPGDPDDAYRYGFYAGIIRGIDTCGVQNYFKRRKIRDTFQQKILEAAMDTTARVTGTGGGGTPKRGRSRRSSPISVDDDFSLLLKDLEDS